MSRSLLLAFLVATAFVAVAPSASAAGSCDSIRDDACAGLVCYGERCVPDYAEKICEVMGGECILDGTILCRGTDLCDVLDP